MFETNVITQDIDALIADLASPDQPVCDDAHDTLVAIGRPAVGPLLEALTDPSAQIRWEAARLLGEIGDPSAAPGLVKALEDEILAIRWQAAEDLIVLEQEGLIALLQALIHHSHSVWLRQGAHRVLRALAGRPDLADLVKPVLNALEDAEPMTVVPIAADTALAKLTLGQPV